MENNKWDLSLIYKNGEEIQADMAEIRKDMIAFEDLQKEKDFPLEKSIEVLERTSIKMSKLIAYSNMKRDEDTRVAENQKLALEVEQLSAQMSEAFSSFSPLVMKMKEEEITAFFDTCKKADYKQVIERTLRNKKHVLSEEQERIVSIASDISNDTENSFYMLSYADMKFPKIESDKEKTILTHANYTNFQTHPDRTVRKESFEKMHDTYFKYSNTFAANYYGHVKGKEKLAQLRKFDSHLQEELFDDNVDTKVYDTLIEAVHEYIPVLSQYMDIKKKYLGIEDLTNYDLYAKLFPAESRKYEYEEAKKIISEALQPMGQEYQEILQGGFKDNWIDVYPQEGKKSGAYSFGTYTSNPYILMNYTDNMNSVFTLIHELGHSIHSYYSRKNNPYFQSNYTIFVAEVASTTNELLLYQYMLKNSKSEEEKKNLMVYNLEQFRTTVFRQTMFAEFEKIVHSKVLEGQAMTAESLNEIYYDLNTLYYPSIKVDDKIAIEWARIPHFYSDYYVYKYATGFSCASFLSQAILNDSKNVSQYIEFLKDGNKNYPVDQLQIAGVDISKKETMCKALDVFKNTVENFK